MKARRRLAPSGLLALFAAAAQAQIAVLSSTVEERTMMPGGRYAGTIVISNPNERPQTARVYQTDYHFAADGTSKTFSA